MNFNLTRLNFTNICQIDDIEENENGLVFGYDENYYGWAKSNWIVSVYNEYVQSYLRNKNDLYNNDTRSILSVISEYAPETDNDSPSDVYYKNIESELISDFQEFVDNLDTRKDAQIYNQLVLQNLITICAYSVIILVSLFGNLLVLFIILSRRQIRSHTTNKLIANLTMSDLLLTTLNIPLTVVRLCFNSWPLGSIFCRLGPLVQAMSVYVSTFSMVVIAIDRHQVLLGSMLERLSTALPQIWTLVIIWLLSAMFSIPHFIFNRVLNVQTYTCVKRCQAIYPKPAQAYSRAITAFTLLTQYVIPLTIIVFCYAQIGMHIWRRSEIGAMTRSQKSSYLQSKKRTLKMLILVVIVFAICWLPLNLYNLYLDFIPNAIYSKSTFMLCHWFGISSVCYNPFIYFWLNKQYKERARAILGICFKWNCHKNRFEQFEFRTIKKNYDESAERTQITVTNRNCTQLNTTINDSDRVHYSPRDSIRETPNSTRHQNAVTEYHPLYQTNKRDLSANCALNVTVILADISDGWNQLNNTSAIVAETAQLC